MKALEEAERSVADEVNTCDASVMLLCIVSVVL